MKTINTTPICVSQIEAIREILGLTATDMAWLLGATFSHWSSILRDARLDPNQLAEPCHALLLRWMMGNPTSSPTVHAPVPGAVLMRLRDAGQLVTAKCFALALGWDATAGSRWTKNSSRISPAGRRALSLLDTPSPKRLADNWFKWSGNAALEARLRGIDLTSSLGWTRTRAALEATS